MQRKNITPPPPSGRRNDNMKNPIQRNILLDHGFRGMAKVRYLIYVAHVICILFTLLSLALAASGYSLTADPENEIEHRDPYLDTNDFMAFVILSGVLLIAGGIIASFIKRDIGKRNMNGKKWLSMLLVFVILLPITSVYIILFYDLTSFEGGLMLGVCYFSFYAPYLYVKRRSILVVEQVPAEFEIKLSSAYRDIFAFGMVVGGLIMMVFAIYHFVAGNEFLGKIILSVAIPVALAGIILVKMWFSFNKISVSTREIKIEKNKEINMISWENVKELIFYRQAAPFLVLELPGYHKKVGKKGTERIIKIVSRELSLEFKDKELPSEEDFRILFFILLYHRKRSNPDSHINFKAPWAKKWYGEYRRYIKIRDSP